MAMDLMGASLTTHEVEEISSNIEQIGKNIDAAMKSVNDIMTTLTGQSEGGLIQKTEEAVKQLYQLCLTLVACLMDIGLKIGAFLDAMINHDAEAANTLRNSIEARVY